MISTRTLSPRAQSSSLALWLTRPLARSLTRIGIEERNTLVSGPWLARFSLALSLAAGAGSDGSGLDAASGER